METTNVLREKENLIAFRISWCCLSQCARLMCQWGCGVLIMCVVHIKTLFKKKEE